MIKQSQTCINPKHQILKTVVSQVIKTDAPTALRQLVLGRQSCWSSKRCLRQTFKPQLPHSQEFLAQNFDDTPCCLEITGRIKPSYVFQWIYFFTFWWCPVNVFSCLFQFDFRQINQEEHYDMAYHILNEKNNSHVHTLLYVDDFLILLQFPTWWCLK